MCITQVYVESHILGELRKCTQSSTQMQCESAPPSCMILDKCNKPSKPHL